jgi:hypothetical protein
LHGLGLGDRQPEPAVAVERRQDRGQAERGAARADGGSQALGLGGDEHEVHASRLAATTVFTTAVDEWTRDPGHGLAASIQDALNDLRTVLGPEGPA